MDLLQLLAEKMHCQYLSDLRYHIPPDTLFAYLRSLSETEYSLQDYTEAANYILGGKASYPGIPEAKHAILRELEKRCPS